MVKSLNVAGLALLVAAALLLASARTFEAQAATTQVDADDDAFDLRDITISAGDAVQWNFTGPSHPHTVTSTTGLFDSGIQSPGSQPFTHTFDTPGVYAYYCAVHGSPGGGGMAGTVTVQGATTPTNTAVATNTTVPSATPEKSVSPTPQSTVTPGPSATSTPAPVRTTPAVIAPAPATPAGAAAPATAPPATGSGPMGGNADVLALLALAAGAGGALALGGAALVRITRR